MQATFKFDPADYDEETLQMIMAKAEEWQCPPSEAAIRLLNELAHKTAA